MAKHSLSLEVLETRNECQLCIIDTSIYADKLPIDCPYIDILVPGFTCAVRLEVQPRFCNLCFTACDLTIQTSDCGIVFNSLPDGVYAIRYSVSPNEYVYVEYNHLRIAKALNKLNELYCTIDSGNCEPSEKNKSLLKKAQEIETLLKAAKAKVEYCHEPKEGMDLYEFAMKKLNKINCSTC
jgi:hypothetical protein